MHWTQEGEGSAFDMFHNLQSYNHMVSCIDRLLRLDRIQKILFALQDKDLLLNYLAFVPVGVLPEVLAFPHGQDVVDEHQHKYLNIVYSIMRWWNMPMLYSYHQDCVKSDSKRERVE